MFDIRPAIDADGPAIAALIERVFDEYPGCPFVPAEFPELVQPASHYGDKGGGLWVLTPNGRPDAIVGSFGLSRVDGSDLFELHKVYLSSDIRGGGWADRLFSVALQEATQRGARLIRLWTDTRFTRGHGYYEKRGFEKVDIIRYLADSTHAWEYAYIGEVARIAETLAARR